GCLAITRCGTRRRLLKPWANGCGPSSQHLARAPEDLDKSLPSTLQQRCCDADLMAMAGPDQASRLPQRALGSLFLAGATIGLLSLLLPHSPNADVAGLYSNVALAFAAGIALWVLGARVPGWSLHLAIAAGTLLI